MQDTLELTSDRVYWWRLLLEEYGPEIIYIKGVDNTVADALSRLDYDPSRNTRSLNYNQCYYHLAKSFSQYMLKHDNVEKTIYSHHIVPMENQWDKKEHIDINHVFAKVEDTKEEIYPVTINEMTSEQKDDNDLKAYFKEEKVEVTSRNKYFSLKVIDEMNV